MNYSCDIASELVVILLLQPFYVIFRFLDDVAVHHLIDALCRLLSESADQAETNKVYGQGFGFFKKFRQL